MKTETLALQSNPNVTLTTYLLDASPEMPNASVRPAVLIFPGGGYRFCSDREAEPVAMAFLAQGYHAFVLRYSLNEHAAFPKPLQDAEEALERIRANAEAWGVIPDKVAVCGFSAGGHLAAALGTMGRIRPNALILAYPVILNDLADLLPAPIPSLEQKVDAQTPPTFLFTTTDDALVPVRHSLAFASALERAGIPFEMHIFQEGAHGLSLATPHTSGGLRSMVNRDVARWVELCIAWLEKRFGEFVSDRELPTTTAASEATCYSVDIPLGVCWSNSQCKQLILSYLPEIDQSPNFNLALPVSLRTVNMYIRALDEVALNELDRSLRAIPLRSVE
ncbi:MAG: alpha/beta hydrolase [Caldilinea sp.]|nr:alpha/beta hydrolase [Caldilinea sp.]MDW8440991.1 alpha/beta hydrolase [Caldilineaceae bacterium]